MDINDIKVKATDLFLLLPPFNHQQKKSPVKKGIKVIRTKRRMCLSDIQTFHGYNLLKQIEREFHQSK
jgi:hypothetical protein